MATAPRMQCGKTAATLLVAAALAVFGASAASQPRDGALQEQQYDSAPGDCSIDPECMRLLKRKMLADAERSAAYDAMPLSEKIGNWFLIGLALWALWHWVGRGPSGRDK